MPYLRPQGGERQPVSAVPVRPESYPVGNKIWTIVGPTALASSAVGYDKQTTWHPPLSKDATGA